MASHKKKSETIISDSISVHFRRMLDINSSVTEVRMSFSIVGEDGVEDVPIVMFLARDPKIADDIREVLKRLLNDAPSKRLPPHFVGKPDGSVLQTEWLLKLGLSLDAHGKALIESGCYVTYDTILTAYGEQLPLRELVRRAREKDGQA